jgi:hypothetical protein
MKTDRKTDYFRAKRMKNEEKNSADGKNVKKQQNSKRCKVYVAD